MNRTLITGAAGFVGANLARCLLQDGYEVHLLLRHTNDNWRLREISAECRIVVGDIRDPEAVRSAVRSVKPQSVFHLAAYGAYSQQTGFQEMAATNLLGSAALLDACVEAGVERFVQTGSSSEYGYKDHAASELEVLDPNSHYAITKAAATHYCTYTARTTGIRAVTARLYSVYGPYEEPSRLIPTLLVHGLKGKLPPLVSPATARDFVHVDDAVRALLELATRDQVRPRRGLQRCHRHSNHAGGDRPAGPGDPGHCSRAQMGRHAAAFLGHRRLGGESERNRERYWLGSRNHSPGGSVTYHRLVQEPP